MYIVDSLGFARVVMLDLACATRRAVRLSGPILISQRTVIKFGRI